MGTQIRKSVEKAIYAIIIILLLYPANMQVEPEALVSMLRSFRKLLLDSK